MKNDLSELILITNGAYGIYDPGALDHFITSNHFKTERHLKIRSTNLLFKKVKKKKKELLFFPIQVL